MKAVKVRQTAADVWWWGVVQSSSALSLLAVVELLVVLCASLFVRWRCLVQANKRKELGTSLSHHKVMLFVQTNHKVCSRV